MIVSPGLSQSFRIIVVRFIRIEGMAQAEQARDHERRRSVADSASGRVLDVLANQEFFYQPGEEILNIASTLGDSDLNPKREACP
jgi:hypothetical protein